MNSLVMKYKETMKKKICECNDMCSCNDKDGNYMFFGNLKTIKKYVDALLQLDPNQVQEILSDGHDWAADHVATSKDDIQEVGDFLMNKMQHDSNMYSYNMQQPQFVPADFGNHLKQLMPERIEQRDGKWVVKPSKGDRILGTHPTKKAALKQLAEIEISKHKK